MKNLIKRIKNSFTLCEHQFKMIFLLNTIIAIGLLDKNQETTITQWIIGMLFFPCMAIFSNFYMPLYESRFGETEK